VRGERTISDARSQIEALFRRHAAGVGSYVMARTGDAELAESTTAQVFALVVRKFDQCRESPAAWLWSIVRNELARHFRDSRAARGQVSLDGGFDAALIDREPPPDHALHRAESSALLHEALGQLDEEQHTIVYMKFFQDLPNIEIAEALDMTANSIGVKVHRALKRLRELMEPKALETAAPKAGAAATRSHHEATGSTQGS
jgi:RNA polymerase sigma-70 factor (ECF subfamily)